MMRKTVCRGGAEVLKARQFPALRKDKAQHITLNMSKSKPGKLQLIFFDQKS